MEKLRKPFLTQPNQHVPTAAVNVGPINISTVAPQTSQHSTKVPAVRGKFIMIHPTSTVAGFPINFFAPVLAGP